MRVQDVLRAKAKNVITIRPDASVLEATKKLSDNRVRILPVLEDNGMLAGLLFERELIRSVAKNGSKALDFPVGVVMSAPLLTASPEDSVACLMRLMTEKRAHHVPVQSNGVFVGVISFGDLLKSRLLEKDQEVEVLRELARVSISAST